MCSQKLRVFLSAALMSFAGFAGMAVADGFVVNAGFEDDVLPLDTWVYQAHGWIITGDAGTFHPPAAAYPGGAPAGINVGFVQSGWGRPTGVLEQTTSIMLTSGMTCSVEATIGRRVDNPLLPWGGYIMSLYAGDTLLSQDITNVHPAAGAFVATAINCTLDTETVGGLVRIRFESLFGQTNIDNVRLVVSPSPSVTSAGMLAALFACRRRRNEMN